MPNGKSNLSNINIDLSSTNQNILRLERTSVMGTTPAICCLIGAILIVYFPAFSNDFLTLWDDQWAVTNQYTQNGFTISNLWHILADYYGGQYAPVNQLYYTTLYSLFGYNSFWFHAGSVIIHVCNTILCYFLIMRLPLWKPNHEKEYIGNVAFLTALVFAIHPFLAESVNWLAGSKIVIYAFFYLLALHTYISYIQTNKLKYYFLTLLFFILSFGAKDQAVTLPICMLLFDKYWGRQFKNRKLWIEKIPYLLLSIFFGYITMMSQAVDGAGVLSDRPQYPVYQRIIFSCYTIFEYFTKCLLPVKLSYVYPFPNVIGEPVPSRFFLYPIFLIAIAYFLWPFWSRRWRGLGILFFLIHIGLVTNLIPLSRFVIVADRYVYIASIGVFFIMAYYFAKLQRRTTKFRKALIAFALLYVVSLGAYTHQRSKVWKNTDTLKYELRNLIKQRPDYNESEN